MKHHRLRCATAVTSALIGLSACGGGGGGSGTPAAPSAPPTSGAYAWALKAQGPTDALKYGLSFLHPSAPDTEFVIESGSSVVTDAKLVSSGSIDQTGFTASALQPYALVYIVGGDVRRVPMQADGSAPATKVQRAQSTTACRFLTDANARPIGDAVDYAAPENSRYVVSTAGPDGQCGTSDDGSAEVKLGGTAGLTFTTLSGGRPLGYFRDSATLAPAGWIFPKTVQYWNNTSGDVTTLRTDSQPAFTSVVSAGYRSALVDDGTQLSVLDFPSGATPTETLLSSAVTGGGGWVGIGFDANNFYAYRNSGTSWAVVKVTRSTPNASVLASGAGTVNVASMGTNQLYVTVQGTSANSVQIVSKTSAVPVQTLESAPTTTLTTVQTSAAGVHELWRITNVGTASVGYEIDMIDETGATLYKTSSGGFPITVPDAATVNFNASESRTRFIFASGYGSRAFGDATLMGFDATAKAATTFGTLPGSADFGSNFVYANVVGGPGSFMTGFAASSVSGSIQSTGTKVFSFDAGTQGSLKYTTSAQ